MAGSRWHITCLQNAGKDELRLIMQVQGVADKLGQILFFYYGFVYGRI